MTSTPDEALGVLRGVWDGQGQNKADIDAACATPKKVCKNMVNVGFDGLADESGDVATAWRARLQREGKLSTKAGSIRDLVLGPQDSH